jgi:gas vesicle protein
MSNTKAVLGFVAGAAVGALVGILLAPDTGSNTRKKITGKAEDLTDSLKSSYDDFVSKLKNVYASGKEEAEEAGNTVRSSVNTMKAEANANLS